MNIYVASSWRNELQPSVVSFLREWGHDVYDFRNPSEGDKGFHWSNIDPEWQTWDATTYRQYVLTHPLAQIVFSKDLLAMSKADAFVLVMPCGRSAHLELGWAVGAGKRTCILLADGEPQLMYLMVDALLVSMLEVVEWLDPQLRPVADCDG